MNLLNSISALLIALFSINHGTTFIRAEDYSVKSLGKLHKHQLASGVWSETSPRAIRRGFAARAGRKNVLSSPTFNNSTRCGLWTKVLETELRRADELTPYFVGVYLTPSLVDQEQKPSEGQQQPTPPQNQEPTPPQNQEPTPPQNQDPSYPTSCPPESFRNNRAPSVDKPLPLPCGGPNCMKRNSKVRLSMCLGAIVNKNSVIIAQSCLDKFKNVIGDIGKVQVVFSYYGINNKPRAKDLGFGTRFTLTRDGWLCQQSKNHTNLNYVDNFAIVKMFKPIEFSATNMPICLNHCQNEFDERDVNLNCKPKIGTPRPHPTTTAPSSTPSQNTSETPESNTPPRTTKRPRPTTRPFPTTRDPEPEEPSPTIRPPRTTKRPRPTTRPFPTTRDPEPEEPSPTIRPPRTTKRPRPTTRPFPTTRDPEPEEPSPTIRPPRTTKRPRPTTRPFPTTRAPEPEEPSPTIRPPPTTKAPESSEPPPETRPLEPEEPSPTIRPPPTTKAPESSEPPSETRPLEPEVPSPTIRPPPTTKSPESTEPSPTLRPPATTREPKPTRPPATMRPRPTTAPNSTRNPPTTSKAPPQETTPSGRFRPTRRTTTNKPRFPVTEPPRIDSLNFANRAVKPMKQVGGGSGRIGVKRSDWKSDKCDEDFFEKHSCRRVSSFHSDPDQYHIYTYGYYLTDDENTSGKGECESLNCGSGDTRFCLDNIWSSYKGFDDTEMVICKSNSGYKEVDLGYKWHNWELNDRWVLTGIGTIGTNMMVFTKTSSISESIAKMIDTC